MRRFASLMAVAGLATALTACSAPKDNTSTPAGNANPSASVTSLSKDDAIAAGLPAQITSAGKVRVASGVSFPPMEFFDTDNKTVLGFDADLAKALSNVLGVPFEMQNTNFDGIIGGLDAGRYDLTITSMIDKKKRQATVDFVDYLSSGVAAMVQSGNPKKIAGPDDLCGRKVAVEKGATGDLMADDLTKACKSAGKAGIDKQAFPDQASANLALQSSRADAVLALDLTLAYSIKKTAGQFALAGDPVGTLPVGIGIPKNDPKLRDAVQAALKKIIAGGTYDQLLLKWGLGKQALKDAPLNTGQ
jgi:polar amino acid transport system substrate-binding protein